MKGEIEGKFERRTDRDKEGYMQGVINSMHWFQEPVQELRQPI
jgi:hypothetical protein